MFRQSINIIRILRSRSIITSYQLQTHNASQYNAFKSTSQSNNTSSSFKYRLFTIMAGFLTINIAWNSETVKYWLSCHFRHLHPLAAELKDSDLKKLEDEEKELGPCEIVKKKHKKVVGFRDRRMVEYENRIRKYSFPEKIFRYFSTLKMLHEDGGYEIFMTPEDFVRSLTPGVLQPRRYGLDKFKVYNHGDKIAYSSKKNIFYWMGRHGLLSYTDYLFLMTLLSTSPNDIHLAFYVYDVNGDGHLDKEEFDRVQELLVSQSNVGQKHRDHSSMHTSFRRGTSSALAKYFFGADGKQKLDVERFLEFQKDLHKDILQIEFERRDSESMPEGIISEVAFADLLLIHAALPDKRRQKMLKRVKVAYKGVKDRLGVSFDECSQYFSFLYQIEKVDIALHFYKLAGHPLDRELLKKVAKKITNVELSDTVIDIVITIFDENGDGVLSHNEFVNVMKKRMNRGLERPKDMGLLRLFKAVGECSKRQVLNSMHS